MVCECNPVLDALIQHILTCLDHYNYSEATFTAERIFAEHPSDEVIFLLATCYYRSNQPKKAKSFLLIQDSKSPKCKFLLAKCFMDIGCPAEAENTLLGVGQDNTTPTDIALFYKETAPCVLLMLASIFKLSDRRKLAVACLKKCLDLNPFFWEAYKDLIDLRENIDPHEVFSLSNGLILNNHSCLRALSNKINIGDISHPNCPSKKRTDMHDSQEDLSVSRENVNPQIDENFVDPMNGNDMISLSRESLPYSFNRTQSRLEIDSANNNNNTNNNNDRMRTNSFKDCISNFDGTVQWRQKLCSLKPHVKDESIDKTKPAMFYNIFTDPLTTTMHTCIPVFNFKMTSPAPDSAENLQTPFAAQNSSLLSHSNSKKNRTNNKRMQYMTFRPVASTPIVPCKSEILSAFSHPSTPITKNSNAVAGAIADYHPSSVISGISPMVTDCNNLLDHGKSIDSFASVADSRIPTFGGGHLEHTNSSSGPRTRSQAAKAAAAAASSQKSGYSIKLNYTKEELRLCKPICETDIRFPCPSSKPALYESDNRLQSALNYLQLLIAMGKCYKSLRQYKVNDVLVNISSLPKNQAETSLVYSWQATAFMEMNNRSKACDILSLSHKCEPWQLYGMVMYSALLWKNNNDAQLMALSNEICEMDRDTPEYWCIIGNTMSAKKENEIAIRFFQRAIQVCPTYTYGFILLGYEYYEQDELDKALSSFRKAVECDFNQYNSYCGIALVHQRQENYIEADKALKEALKINPESSFLLTNLAGIRMKLKQFYSYESSLELLEKACQMSPKDPLSRFQKAKLLYQLGKYHESLADLKILESLINKEARIYYLMSLIYKQLGDFSKAMVYNKWATERDPKCTNDAFIFDRSFVTTPVINMTTDHNMTNSSSSNGGGGVVVGNRNGVSVAAAAAAAASVTAAASSFSISVHRNSDSSMMMQQDDDDDGGDDPSDFSSAAVPTVPNNLHNNSDLIFPSAD